MKIVAILFSLSLSLCKSPAFSGMFSYLSDEDCCHSLFT
uniref:Uncharacterized protein n=1 Tax=Rhizophora mucronata TaxID=61149 RepID=A0A2P2IUV0_RHIMU